MQGIITWFDAAKGFGFISYGEQGREAFVHYSAIKMDGFINLVEGQKVNFNLVEGPKGPQAFDVIPE